MLNAQSVKTRFLVSVVGNGARAVLSFGAGLLVARGLQPSAYGDLMFLLGSLGSFLILLNLGTSDAFFTFLSRGAGGKGPYVTYFGWMLAQFVLVSSGILIWLPDGAVQGIWVGHPRALICVAYVSVFMQQIWVAVGQVGEAHRQTVKVQLLNLSVAASHILIVGLLMFTKRLSIASVLVLFAVEYATAAAVAFVVYRRGDMGRPGDQAALSLKETVREFWRYCRPLILLSAVGFLYDFADKWMLQRFAGASQQGFYQIANQFTVVSLLATTSVLKVFWKEVAEAHADGDLGRMKRVYVRFSRALVMIAAVLSGFAIPWAKEILTVALGPAFVSAWPVLAILFLYPIHQSMGQIGGAMFLARGETKTYMLMSVAVMLVSLPLSYLVQAPSKMIVPGLGLGAAGMAIKMVLVNVIGVNLQAWLIARGLGWRWEWRHQLVSAGAAVGFGYLAKAAVLLWWDLERVDFMTLLPPMVAAGLLYVAAFAGLVWVWPSVIGVDREELKRLLRRRAVA